MGSAERTRLEQAREALELVRAQVRLDAIATRPAHNTNAALPTGVPKLDEVLCGGLPCGKVTDVMGARSSGRMSLALNAVAHTLRTQTGSRVAFIDAPDALDPRTVRALPGLDDTHRARLLWVRPRTVTAAMQCADIALDAGSFALVVLYLAGVACGRSEQPSPGAWARLAQRTARARASLLIVRDLPARLTVRSPGPFAHLGLVTERARPTAFVRTGLLERAWVRVHVGANKLGIAPVSTAPFSLVTA